jgi:ABC-type nitrate/sulfonate/bicarbonate transport system substrate-binding protein
VKKLLGYALTLAFAAGLCAVVAGCPKTETVKVTSGPSGTTTATTK